MVLGPPLLAVVTTVLLPELGFTADVFPIADASRAMTFPR